MEKILRGMILESLREAGRLQPLTNEAGRKKAADPYSVALQSLIGLTKDALEGGMTAKYLGQSREATREILEKIMIPWIKQNYDYLESGSTSFGESTQMLSALTGPAGKKVFRPEFAAHFGKTVTPENKELAFKVRDMIKNNLITGFIINGSRAFWKLHLIAVGELLGKNPPQLKARNPQEQENYEAEKERFKRDYGDIVTGGSLEEGEDDVEECPSCGGERDNYGETCLRCGGRGYMKKCPCAGKLGKNCRDCRGSGLTQIEDDSYFE